MQLAGLVRLGRRYGGDAPPLRPGLLLLLQWRRRPRWKRPTPADELDGRGKSKRWIHVEPAGSSVGRRVEPEPEQHVPAAAAAGSAASSGSTASASAVHASEAGAQRVAEQWPGGNVAAQFLPERRVAGRVQVHGERGPAQHQNHRRLFRLSEGEFVCGICWLVVLGMIVSSFCFSGREASAGRLL